MKKIFLVTLLAIIVLTGCKKETDNRGKWDDFTNNFIKEYLDRNPVRAVHAGLHQYDGQFSDLSPAGIQNEIKWLRDQQKKVVQFDEKDLSGKEKFERESLISIIDGELFWLEDAKAPFKNPMFYLGLINPSVYLTRDYAPLDKRMQSYIKYANNLPLVLKYMKENLSLPLPKTFATLGKNSFTGYVEFFTNDLPEIFESVKSNELQKEFALANKNAIESVTEMRDWFEKILPGSNGSYSLGSDLFRKMLLKTEKVDVPLAELKKIGEADLQRNLTALKKACKEYAPGKSFKECIAIMNSNKPKGGAVKGAAEQLKMLKQFIIDKNIVSIPGKEEALVAEAPPYNRWNFAYIEDPGIYEKDLPAIYYIAPPDPNWPKDVQEKYIPGNARLLFTSVHEVWPGHFLHSLHIRNGNNPLAGIFWDYAYGEGWAHYTEEMMYDEGLGNYKPEKKIGQLIAAFLRNVRFLSAIGLHTEGISVEESKQMFTDNAFSDEGNASQQAARGTYDPAYLNYTMGKLMIRKLKTDWLNENPGKTLKDFHDKFLSYGSGPIPLVRKYMLKNSSGSLF